MKASIIIRAYNAEDTIRRAMERALSQNYLPEQFEIIAVADGSTDATGAILDGYASEARICVFHQSNKGGTAAANRGLKQARGEYVTILDSDDAFEPDLLLKLIPILDENSDVDFVYPDYYEVKNGERSVVSPKHIFETVAIGVLFRREKIKGVGYYRDGILFSEYDLLLRTIDEWKGYHLAEPLFTYYRHAGSATADASRVQSGLEELQRLHPNREKEISMIRSY